MEEIKGYVSDIIFRNEDNLYTVFEITTVDGTLTCTGSPASVSVGESCVLTGEYREHPVYGLQFHMASYRSAPPEGAAAAQRYLASGAVKGIGAALAARIVKKFGDDTLKIMEEQPERLSEVKGISENGAREIAAVMGERRDLRDAMLFLQRYDIGNALAVRIWKTYGMAMYGILREKPVQAGRGRGRCGLCQGGRDRTPHRHPGGFRIPHPLRAAVCFVCRHGRRQQLPAFRRTDRARV
jgi:exodeoxyribonuclease V alpha subunit